MGIVFLICMIKKGAETKIPNDQQFTKCRAQYILNITNVAYVREVVHWCIQNIGIPNGNKKIPGVMISYVKQDKLLGIYCSAKKEICIYVHAHIDLLQLTNTVIHEYDHFLRIRNIKDQKNYNKVLNEIGYDKHPLEIYARETADKYEMNCFKEMAERGLLLKK
jgi:hypothetical protein